MSNWVSLFPPIPFTGMGEKAVAHLLTVLSKEKKEEKISVNCPVAHLFA